MADTQPLAREIPASPPSSGIDDSFSDIIKRASGLSAETNALTQDLAQSAKLKRGIAEKLITDRPPPAPQIPAPQPPPLQVPDIKPLQEWGNSAAGLIAVFGGMLTKQPLIASLNASAGAMNAFRQRDLLAFEQNYKIWKAQSEYASQLATWSNQRYQQTMEQYKGDHDSMLAAMQAIASSDQDTVMMHTLKSGDLRTTASLLNDRINIQKQFNDFSFKLDELAERKRHDLAVEDRLGSAKTQKQQQQSAELQGILGQINSLEGMLTKNPGLAGVKGAAEHALNVTVGQVIPMRNERFDFEAKMKQLQTMLQSRFLNSRYFSGKALERMEELVPGLGPTEPAQETLSNLEELRKIINTQINAGIPGGGSGAANSLSDEQILKELGIQ